MGNLQLIEDINRFGVESSMTSLEPILLNKNPRLYVESAIPREKGF